jgi:conjugal transfer ATP-binding protein TraC
LHVYQILTDDGTPAEPEVVFAAHLQFLESFFKITLSGITSDSLEELNNILTKVYSSKGISEHTNCINLKAEDYPTFDDLYNVVCNELQQEKLPSRVANLERVKTYVAKFATGGRFATLWNGPSTLMSDERLIVFNFQSLFGAKNNIVANAQMLVIMRYLDQQIINIREMNRVADNPIHPFVVLDEGYNFIDAEYPVALDFVFLWYKRIRKYNGSIMFLTQNLSDIMGNVAVVQKTTAIINNAQYSFIFSLAPADLEILTELYRNAGAINDTERSQIANAGNGECFAICSPKERTSFHVVASDIVYTLFEYPNALDKIEQGDVRSPYNK